MVTPKMRKMKSYKQEAKELTQLRCKLNALKDVELIINRLYGGGLMGNLESIRYWEWVKQEIEK